MNYEKQTKQELQMAISIASKKKLLRSHLASLSCLILLALSLFGCERAFAVNREPLPPRMWHVTGRLAHTKAVDIYILGVTHNGLPEEYDEYFFTRALPAFFLADVMGSEGAAVGVSPAVQCSVPVTDRQDLADVEVARTRAIELLTKQRELLDEAILRLNPELFKERPTTFTWDHYAHSIADPLNDFNVMATIIETTYAIAAMTGDFEPPIARFNDGVQVATSLTLTKPQLPFVPVDSTKEMIRAYCDSGVTRIHIFRSLLRPYVAEFGATQPTDANPKMDQMTMEGRASEARELLVDQRISVDSGISPTEAEAFICQRTKNWIARIDTLQSAGTVYLAVGINHLFPVLIGSTHCQGLLDDLRALGLDVELVP